MRGLLLMGLWTSEAGAYKLLLQASYDLLN